MKNNHKPEIRFLGYTGNWEEYKLGDIAEKVSVGIATSSSQYFSHKNQGIPFIKNQNVKENWIDSSDLEYISKEFDQANATKRVREGDILTVRTGYPGLSAVVPKELEGAQTFTTLITRLKKDTAIPEFISAFINSDTGMKQILGMEAGGAQKNVNAGILKELLIQLPSLEEQKKVSSFIKELSNTIAFHQQELTILKQTKQGFLQKMFPKEGESVPEVRFSGFNGDWEKRKLGEMSESFEYGLNASATEYDGENKYIRITDIDDSTHEFLEENLTSPNIDLSSAENYLVKEGDILFARTGASVGKSYIYDKKDGKVYYAGFLIRARIKSGYNPGFIFQNTLTSKYSEFIKVTSQRSGQPGVNAQEYANFSLMVPNNDEQIKIGKFFKQLDDTIALHQRELDALNQMKKAFLQKMFV
ncbi:restriction endonuclease subunit S [Bacillus toyonensis]|uniref:restriction endonuclease subunit S n=1 Tax=Bacillus toyonensis TaxID=155322 RepID=UPI003CF11D35